jgi:hypothetical protein
LLPLGACNKIIDWKDVWDKHKPDCRIGKIITYSDFSPTRTGIFNYNQKGDPVSVIFDYTATGYSDFMFLYDHKGRIKDYLATYPGGSYQLWYSYTYDARGRVISDTLNQFGTIENGVPQPNPNPNYKFYGNYEYDAYGRVVKVDRYRFDNYPGPGQIYYTEEYTYNDQGNLVLYRQGDDIFTYITINYGPYDNKVNMRQTNKVWMFVDRNYSRNNAATADIYNNKGLPLKFNLPESVYMNFLWEISLKRSDIFYSCRK